MYMCVTNYINYIDTAYCTMRHYRKNYEIAKNVETSWIFFIPKNQQLYIMICDTVISIIRMLSSYTMTRECTRVSIVKCNDNRDS